MSAVLLGLLACAAWTYLLAARGGFWRAQPRDFPADASLAQPWPRVVAIVPARDEAQVIEASIASLLAQDYPGELSLVLVDDASSDGTAAKARAAAAACGAAERLVILSAPPRPDGWTGKLWAVHTGTKYVQGLRQAPHYLLLTDADIVHTPDSVRALVTHARGHDLVLVSLMAKLRCESAVERAFVPAFVFFFQMLYPFAWVNRPDRGTAAAAGGCMLIAAAELERAGGIAAIRGALIDDCALARLVKARGAIWLGLTERVASVRPYVSLTEIRRMVVRSAYAQLGFSPLLLAVTVLGMGVTYAAAPALALFGSGMARALGSLAWAQMALAFQPTLRFYRVSPAWGLALPAIAAAYVAFTLESAYDAARGRAGQWKGRVYPARRT